MKKQLHFLLIAIVVMFMLPFTGSAATVTFKYVYENEAQNVNKKITLYDNGFYLGSSDWGYDNKIEIYLEDEAIGHTLSYRSELGHTGTVTVTDGVTVNLPVNKFTLTAKDQNDNPVDGYVWITAHGRDYGNYNCNNGTVTVYLKADANYAYTFSYNTVTYNSRKVVGAFDLTNDVTVPLTVNTEGDSPTPMQDKYTLTIIPRYDGMPVLNNNSYGGGQVYTYSETKEDLYDYYYCNYDGNYGAYMCSNLLPGSYMFRDMYGGFSDEITLENNNKTVFIDYHKVTFTSKNTDPNVWKEIRLNDYTLTTDGKGQVDFYLMPGTYTYEHAGQTKELVVADQDLTVDLTTYNLGVTFQCSDLATMINNNSYMRLEGPDGSRRDYNIPTDGKIDLTLQEGTYKAYYSGMLCATFVADANKAVTVKMYKVKFTRNMSPTNGYSSGIYFRRGGDSDSYENISFNRDYFYPEGDYMYSYNWNDWNDLTLNQDREVAQYYYKATVTVTDTNGQPASGIEVRVREKNSTSYGSSASTNEIGQAVLIVAAGEYEVSSQYDKKELTLTSDQNVTLTCPPIVHFAVTLNGEPFTMDHYHFYLYPEDSRYESIPVTFTAVGQAQARLYAGENYGVEEYQGTTKIEEGSTVALGTFTVTSQGLGLAFPMSSWGKDASYDVVVGATVRIAAVPVGEKFTKWSINGKDYTDPMIDFKTTESNTTATAIFGNGAINNIQAVESGNFDLKFGEKYITLPRDVEGSARIYTLDGRLVKSVGVVGDQIGIYDLPTGNYLISLEHDGTTTNARFLKK